MIDLGSRAYVGTFYDRLETEFAGSWASQLGWMNPNSNQESETYKWLGQVPALREWVTGRSAKGLRTEGYTLRNKLFEATVPFDVDDLRRDKTGQVNMRIGELGTRAAQHWEKLVSSLITTNGLCYDGQNFFDTDHASGASGAQKNLLTASEVADLNVGTATAPTPDEAAKALIGMTGWFWSFVDDQGEPYNGRARSFVCQVGTPALYAAFQTAVGVNNLTSGASNPVQGFKSGGINIDVQFNPRLSAGTAYVYLFRVDAEAKPFILQEELPPSYEVIGAGSEEEFKNRQHLVGTSAMRNAGYGLWQYALRGTLS